jgi:hypothetical protein
VVRNWPFVRWQYGNIDDTSIRMSARQGMAGTAEGTLDSQSCRPYHHVERRPYSSNCGYEEQRLQVDLAAWYIRHNMTLTAILSDLTRRQDQVLEPETQALLRSVDPGDRRGGWLDRMRMLLQREMP